MELSELTDRLKNHDYYYEYSDDYSVWRRGQDVKTGLIASLKELPFEDAKALVESYVPEALQFNFMRQLKG